MQTAPVENQIDEISANIGLRGDRDQCLTFMLGGEEYGVDIHRVEEIKGWDRVTPVPNTPDYMLGVINLRGAIVPVADLRQRFGMPVSDYGPTTVVIVLRVKGEDRERVMGVVVDAVSDVYDIPEEERKPPPSSLCNVMMESINALATVEEKMIIMLDIDHLLNTHDMNSAIDSIND